MSQIAIIGKDRPLIPPGEYEATLLYWETNQSAFKGKPKVYLSFRSITPPYFGVELFAAYNVKSVSGKKRNGSFKLSRHQQLTYELGWIQPDFRIDRVTLKPLLNRVIKVRVRSVTQNYRQKPLPPPLHYSVVDQMLSLQD